MRHRLTGRRQFAAVRAERISASSGAVRVHLRANGFEHPRLGFVVPRQAGGAVVRNRIRRRLRAALMPHHAELSGIDLVVSAGAPAAQQSYAQLAEDLARCLARTLPQARARARRTRGDAGGAPLTENGSIRPGPRRGLAPTPA